MFRIPPSPPFL